MAHHFVFPRSTFPLIICAVINIVAAGSANAAPVAIYGGGDTAAVSALQDLANCAGIVPTGMSVNAACTNPGTAPGFEYLFSSSNYDADASNSMLHETVEGASHFTPATDQANNFGSFPYPLWDLSVTLTPLDALPPTSVGSYATVSYDKDNTLNGDGFTDQKNRGYPWQIPFAINAIALAYNPAQMSFGVAPGGSDGEDHALQLTTDAVCYIYTKQDAAGNPVSGSYDWSNAIFTSISKGKKTATVNGGVQIAAPSALPIVAFARAGAPGETYQLTEWLLRHCAGYATAFNSSATTGSPSPVFPSWVASTYSAGGGTTNIVTNAEMMAAIAATPGAIGYVDRSAAEPVAPASLPTAYIETGFSQIPAKIQYIAPTNAALDAAVSTIVPPKSHFHSGGYYSRPYAWGSALVGELQGRKGTKGNGAYPLAGLAYVSGYACYDEDSSNNDYDGVLGLLSFIYSSNTATEADAILRGHGYEPLDVDPKTGANGFLLPQQALNVVTTDLHHLVGVTSSETFTNHKNGPIECPDYRLDKKAS